ncbi:MAG: AraC family transcriptional regulator [Clostridia bacterium]|nr:AraC family transcriptional regulator [Clostridia bacterium]
MKEISNEVTLLNTENSSKRKFDNELFMLLLEKYKINPFSNLSVKDVARDLGMNQNTANQLFKRSDFPSINFTKPKQICVLAYYLWKLERKE